MYIYVYICLFMYAFSTSHAAGLHIHLGRHEPTRGRHFCQIRLGAIELHTHTHIYIYIYMYSWACLYTYTSIYWFIFTPCHVCLLSPSRRTLHPRGPLRADTRPTFGPDPPWRHINTHTHTDTRTHTHTHIYIYIYIYICIHDIYVRLLDACLLPLTPQDAWARAASALSKTPPPIVLPRLMRKVAAAWAVAKRHAASAFASMSRP